jgi:hypothetical protein
MLGKLFKSRKFLLLIFDFVLVVALVMLARFVDPNLFQDIYFVIVLLQLPFVAMIRAITIEDTNNYEDFDPLPPLIMLFKSKQWWVVMFDIAIVLVGYFSSKYLDEQAAKDTKWMIGLIQPMVLFIIDGWTKENAEAGGWLIDDHPFPELPDTFTPEELLEMRMKNNEFTEDEDQVSS